MQSMDIKELWKNCLLEIETGVSKANFSTWFKNTSILKEDTGIIYVGVPNEFVRDWLKNKYHKLGELACGSQITREVQSMIVARCFARDFAVSYLGCKFRLDLTIKPGLSQR